jgi:hypothetical protein
LASALLFCSLSFLPAAEARLNNQHRSVKVQLANGKTVTFRMVRIGGRMMMIAPASVFGPVVNGG